VSGNWQSESLTNYLNNNTTPDATDNHRIRIPVGAVLGGWTSISLTQYNQSNVTAADGTDGVQIANATTSPFTLWQDTTQATYNAGNTVNTAADGYKIILSAASQTPWTTVTSTEYNNSNTSASATDGSDGYQAPTSTTAPYTLWQNSTESAYNTGNVDSSTTDGWKTITSGASQTPWTGGYSQTSYNKSNTTGDSSDGWRIQPIYTAPYSSWEASTQSAYNAGQPGTPSGWRTYHSYTAPFLASEVTDGPSYVAGKTNGDPLNNGDGWTATKIYVPPYTGYDATRTYSKTNRQILGDLIDPAGLVDPIKDATGTVINAEVANMYSSTNWSDVKGALQAIALGQCGGTLTLQTRIGGTTPANDTFTYSNSLSNTKVETSGSKRSGTFDFAIPSGGSITVEIQQARTTVGVDHYAPTGSPWSCKAGGVAVTPTIVDVPGPWESIRLTIAANQAVSCIQNVTFTP
jgi:hypothetical protein